MSTITEDNTLWVLDNLADMTQTPRWEGRVLFYDLLGSPLTEGMSFLSDEAYVMWILIHYLWWRVRQGVDG